MHTCDGVVWHYHLSQFSVFVKYKVRSIPCRSSNFSVPRPVTYGAQSQLTFTITKGHKSSGTHRIPSRYGRESFSFAARVRAGRDIGEAFDALTVQKGVEVGWDGSPSMLHAHISPRCCEGGREAVEEPGGEDREHRGQIPTHGYTSHREGVYGTTVYAAPSS